jgi:hypothetical protein
MRVMVMVKATNESEAGQMPSTVLLAAMGRYNEELVKAGVMLAGEGLHPSGKIEIPPVFEAEDFGAEFTPALRAQEGRLRAEVDSGGGGTKQP